MLLNRNVKHRFAVPLKRDSLLKSDTNIQKGLMKRNCGILKMNFIIVLCYWIIKTSFCNFKIAHNFVWNRSFICLTSPIDFRMMKNISLEFLFPHWSGFMKLPLLLKNWKCYEIISSFCTVFTVFINVFKIDEFRYYWRIISVFK